MAHLSSDPIENTASAENAPCYLLKLPLELQLDIYELVVIEGKPLLVNCPCNSSYRGRKRWDQRREDERAWREGEIQPPMQPALTRTCRFIRSNALPIFYKENIFRATYCTAIIGDLENGPVRWLRMIGRKNREMLQHFYFYDRNPGQDRSKQTLQKLRDCPVFSELGGKMETLSNQYCCAHLVNFGDEDLLPKNLSIFQTHGVPRLRVEGEE